MGAEPTDLDLASSTYLDGWFTLACERRRRAGAVPLDLRVRAVSRDRGPGAVVRVYTPGHVEQARAVIAAAEVARECAARAAPPCPGRSPRGRAGR